MKLVIIGIVLIAAVTFGFWFWGQLSYNQNELANLPVGDSSVPQPASEVDAASLEAELNDFDLEGLDAEASEMDLSGL